MTVMQQENVQKQRRVTMNTEHDILLKLTDFLEKEKLISVEERNRAVSLIEKEDKL